MSDFQQAKGFFVEHLNLEKDALHIYVALAVFFGSCLLMRWRASQWKPLLLVLLVAVAGEAWDLRDELVYNDPLDPGEHLKDLVNTMLVPTIIVLLARYSRLFRRA